MAKTMMTLHKGTVLAIIDLWHAYQAMQQDSAKRGKAGELHKAQGLINVIRNPITHKLNCVVADLAPQARGELAALMWLGREGGTKKDFPALVEKGKREVVSSYLTSKNRLDEYLLRGMDIMDM